MRRLTFLLLGLSGFAFANTGGLDGEYTDREIEALSIVIQRRLERGDGRAAITLAKRFIIDHSEDYLQRQTHGHKKHRLVRRLVQSPAWREADRDTQAAILKIALKYGPLTPRYERELLYLLARTGTLEGMAVLLGRALSPETRSYAYLPNSLFESILSRWIYIWHRLGADHLLSWENPVQPYEPLLVLQDWLKRFSHPDQLVAMVNASTSTQALEALPLLIRLRRDWPSGLSETQSTRLRFWRQSRGCEDELTGRES